MRVALSYPRFGQFCALALFALTGGVVAAGLMGLIGYPLSYRAIFLAAAALNTTGPRSNGCWPIGWGAAALIATLFFTVFSQEVAWRALFWLGLSPALLVFFVRRFVSEPPVFARTQANLMAAGKKTNFLAIFSPTMLRTTVLTCLLSTGARGVLLFDHNVAANFPARTNK
jgi:MFS family permease